MTVLATSSVRPSPPAYRRRAAERFARRHLPTAAAPAVRLRLSILHDELERALDEQDAARLMILLAEGLHEGVFRAISYQVHRPLISVRIDVDGPPHQIALTRKMPMAIAAEVASPRPTSPLREAFTSRRDR